MQSQIGRINLTIYTLALILALFALKASLFPPPEYYRWNEYTEKFDFTTPYFNLKYSGTSGNTIDDHVLQFGAWDKPALNLLKNISRKINQENLVFVDIGANTGLYSLFMSQISKEVHAIEPYPPILTKLNNNIKLNNLQNIFVHEVGFGNKNDSLQFYSPPDNNLGVGTFSSSFSNEFDSKNKKIILKLDIRIGDEYLSSKGINKIDLLKLDIEGYEKYALEGLSKLLNLNRPFILIELNIENEEGFKSLKEITNTLPANYALIEMVVEFKNLIDGTYTLKPFEFKRSQSYAIAYPKEKEDIINAIKNPLPLTKTLE